MHCKKFLKLCCGFIFVFFVSLVQALPQPIKHLENERDCKKIIAVIEKYYGIPRGLLRAIGKTESSFRPYIITKARRTINFGSKEGLWHYLKTQNIEGSRDFYVGCMQLSYKHHVRKSKDISKMLIPAHNIHYAARLLIKHYKRFGSWKDAVRHYHSYHRIKNTRYQQRVFSHWRNKTVVS